MMSQDTNTPLTDEEQAAFAALPRDADPGRLLEERTVKALRVGGLLGARRVRRTWSAAMVAAGVAASIAFFASGLAAGQWLATRTVATSIATASQENAMQVAAAVQRSGSAYVTALAALGQLSDTASAESIAQGREAALSALYAAVGELVLLAPDDPLSATIRELMDRRAGESAGANATTIRNVVWF
jgi:hypothetical protein